MSFITRFKNGGYGEAVQKTTAVGSAIEVVLHTVTATKRLQLKSIILTGGPYGADLFVEDDGLTAEPLAIVGAGQSVAIDCLSWPMISGGRDIVLSGEGAKVVIVGAEEYANL